LVLDEAIAMPRSGHFIQNSGKLDYFYGLEVYHTYRSAANHIENPVTNTTAVRGMTKKSAAHGDVLCRSYRRVTVILSILCHTNWLILSPFLVKNSIQLQWNRMKTNFGIAGDAKSLVSHPLS
jgi:hypothetical protein